MTPEQEQKIIENQRLFHAEIRNLWQSGIKSIFGATIPDKAEWSDVNDISSVLNKVTSFKKPAHENIRVCANNHTFYPDGGGNDLYTCNTSIENGCIELDFIGENNAVEIVRPAKLYFEKVDNSFDWSYFRLETASLMPLYDSRLTKRELDTERLYELDGEYYEEIDDSDFNNSRIIIRRMKQGSYVMFHKASLYNMATGKLDAYDGRHNKMTPEEFRAYIQQYHAAAKEFDAEKITA